MAQSSINILEKSMKYVRNFDDFKKFSFEFFDSFLPQQLSEEMVNSFILNFGDEESLTKRTLEEIKRHNLGENEVAEYGEAILQLGDFRDILKRFVELLLKSQSFEQLCAFLNRIFLPQIGDKRYHSCKKDYTINERYFDRFVEIINFCKIAKELYSPFFLAILNSTSDSKLFVYKEPLKEYLDVFLSGDNDTFVSELLSSENKTGIDEYTSLNNQKTAKSLIYDYAFGEINNSSVIKKLLVKNRQDSFLVLDELLKNDDEQVRFRACQMLALIKEDRRVMDRLKYIYVTTSDTKIKSFLERECSLNSLENFASEETFLSYVDKTIVSIQERLFGARLKRYYEEEGLENKGLNGKILTFVLEFFKSRDTDVQMAFVKEYLKYIDKNTATKLANVVYKVGIARDKLLKSKWALRLIAVFGDEKLLKELTSVFVSSQEKTNLKYFINLLSQAGNEQILSVVKELLSQKSTPKQEKYLTKKLKNYSQKNNQNYYDIQDKLANDFGFDSFGERTFDLGSKQLVARINSDLTLSLFNKTTGKKARIQEGDTFEGENLRTVLKDIEKGIKKERKRLYKFYLEFRQYDLDSFKSCILENNLLFYMAKRLFWGKYKVEGLAEVCVLDDDGSFKHIAGNMLTEGEYSLAILQSVDGAEYKNALEGRIDNLFDQLDLPIYIPSKEVMNTNYVDVANGKFCNAKLFVTRLEKMKFKINDLDSRGEFGMLVKENRELDLLTCVMFDRVNLHNLDMSTTLSRVCFFDLSKLTKSGKNYNLAFSEALMIGSINVRVLSNEIGLILNATKS